MKAKGEGTWIVGGANTDETFRGVIDDKDQAGSHPGKTSIVKTGSGDWRLTGANTYSGTTKVEAGTLIVNGTHSGSGAITVNSGATLAGKGTLTGAVTMNGTLMVGDTLATDKVRQQARSRRLSLLRLVKDWNGIPPAFLQVS